MEDIAYYFSSAVNNVKGTFGEVGQTIQDGIRNVRDMLASVPQRIIAWITQMRDSLVTALQQLWNDHPMIIVGVAAAAVLTITVWGPVVLHMLMNVPRTVLATLKLPLVLLGLAR